MTTFRVFRISIVHEFLSLNEPCYQRARGRKIERGSHFGRKSLRGISVPSWRSVSLSIEPNDCERRIGINFNKIHELNNYFNLNLYLDEANETCFLIVFKQNIEDSCSETVSKISFFPTDISVNLMSF